MKTLRLILLFFIIISCAKKEETLVTIGGTSYSTSDFKDQYQFAPTDDSTKRLEKINDFINQLMVIQEARKNGYEEDPVVTASFETNRKEIIARGFYEARVTDRIKIPENELKKVYNQFIDQYHLYQIVVASDSVAQYLGEEVKKNVPFDSLCKFSLDTLTENGDIGMVPAIYFPPEMLSQLKRAKIGSVVGPIKLGEYFYFFQIIEHKKADQPKFSEVKENIKNSLLRQKTGEQADKFIQKIIDGAKIEYNQEGLDALIKADSFITEKDLNTWVVKKYDTFLVYVKNIRDAVRYQYQQSQIEPKKLIERELIPDLVYDAAMKANAENYPKIKKELKKALATLLYQKFYSDAVLEKAVIDSAEVKNYYKLHKDQYQDKKFSEIYNLLSNQIREAKIDSLRKNLFEDLRKEYNPEINKEARVRLLKEEK